MLINKAAADDILPSLGKRLDEAGVVLRGDAPTQAILSASGISVSAATELDWDEEYLDLVLSIKVVADTCEAINHINNHGSGHTEAIVTKQRGQRQTLPNGGGCFDYFLECLDAICIDGGQFGMGAGDWNQHRQNWCPRPDGLEELTSYKWLGVADGLVRE